jgi:hypothetical protein
VKWVVIVTAYLLVGLVKLVTIVVVLAFFTSRAAIRRMLDAKDRRDGGDDDEYDLGYPSHVGRSSERLTQDAFDARWQRERDLRVAQRQVGDTGRGEPRATVPRDDRAVDETGNAAIPGVGHGSFGPVAATSNGHVHHETRELGWKGSDRSDRGATVIRP